MSVRAERYMLILCPPNLFLRYSGIVYTPEAMYTGTKTQPRRRMKNTDCK